MDRKLEICADTFTSAKNAEAAGADRIELCSDLQTGGITPSFSFVEKVVTNVNIPVNILIRPRPGCFYYTDDEFEIMCNDIKMFKELKINGFVSGVLQKNGYIDSDRTRKLIELSRPLEFTFHRAIDNSADFRISLKDIIDTGADRVLTSGGYSNINGGMENLLDAFEKHGNDIIIMPGGGLDINNAKTFINAGFREFHFSASQFQPDECYNNPLLFGMGHYQHNNERGYSFSSVEKIKEMKEIIAK